MARVIYLFVNSCVPSVCFGVGFLAGSRSIADWRHSTALLCIVISGWLVAVWRVAVRFRGERTVGNGQLAVNVVSMAPLWVTWFLGAHAAVILLVVIAWQVSLLVVGTCCSLNGRA